MKNTIYKTDLEGMWAYDEKMGKRCPLVWKNDRSRIKAGDQVSWFLNGGYPATMFFLPPKNRFLRIHRAVSLMNSNYATMAELPQVDHIDRDRQNNLVDNLRTVTVSQSLRNRAKSKGATSQYRGVTFNKTTGQWEARVCWGGKTGIFIGRYRTEIEAAYAYDDYLVQEIGREKALEECFIFNFPLRSGIVIEPDSRPRLLEIWEPPPRPQLMLDLEVGSGEDYKIVGSLPAKRLPVQFELFPT